MINFELIALFLFFALIFGCGFILAKNIRFKYLIKISKLNILRRQQKTNMSFYADVIVGKCVKILFFKHSKKARQALAELTFGKTKNAELILAKKNPVLALFLRAHTDIKAAYSELKKHKKILKGHKLYLLLFALIQAEFFDYEEVRGVIKNINPKKIHGIHKAYYNLVSAYVYIIDADMLSASANASAALKYFQKHDILIEEAKAYLLLGEIYRITYVSDVAQTMIESAIKIYKKSKLTLFEGKATAMLGMLFVSVNRLDEAEDKFKTALEISQSEQLKAEVLNQLALLEIARKNSQQSFYYANKAFELHNKAKNMRGMALSLQLLAHINKDKNRPNKALNNAQKATVIYEKQKNFSALCECLYLQSSVLYKQKKLKKSEEILRRILQISAKNACNFHQANAFSLLGLIYLQKNDLSRAKVLIQQSLHLEQRNERANGMVADYANLSLIENLRGDKNAANSNLQTALEYALKTEEEELIKLIKSRI